MLLVLMPSTARGVVVGGYDVAAIARETVALLADRGVISADEAGAFSSAASALPSGDPLVAAGPVVDLYEKLLERLVAHGVFSAGDVERARAAASSSGGVKAGGVNPLVLAAACLDILAEKGLLSRGEAQKMLDKAKLKA